jgi:hypothetical protein
VLVEIVSNWLELRFSVLSFLPVIQANKDIIQSAVMAGIASEYAPKRLDFEIDKEGFIYVSEAVSELPL